MRVLTGRLRKIISNKIMEAVTHKSLYPEVLKRFGVMYDILEYIDGCTVTELDCLLNIIAKNEEEEE